MIMMESFVLATGALAPPTTCGLPHHIDCPYSLLSLQYIRGIVLVLRANQGSDSINWLLHDRTARGKSRLMGQRMIAFEGR